MTDRPLADGGRDRSDRPVRLAYELGDDESPSEAVVRAVAALTNTSVLDLDPLYDAIDPEHLDSAFEGDDPVGMELSFEFYGCDVTVTGDEVRVYGDGGD